VETFFSLFLYLIIQGLLVLSCDAKNIFPVLLLNSVRYHLSNRLIWHKTYFMKEQTLNIKAWIAGITFFSITIIGAMFMAAGVL
jgi:hypothetical protein